MVKHINENEFNQVIQNELVLIDFFAEWCGPCKMLAPILEELNNTRNFKVYKVNVDENENLSKTLGIMSIPTLMLYSNGKLLSKKMGFMSEAEIQEWVDENK